MKQYELQIYRKSDGALVAKGSDHEARKQWKDELIAELPAGTHVNNGDYWALNHDPEGVELDSTHVDLIGFDIPRKQAPAPAASEADDTETSAADSVASSSADSASAQSSTTSSSAE